MTLGRWISLCWGGMLMVLLMIMNAIVLHQVTTMNGVSLYEDIVIPHMLMRRITLVLIMDLIFCFATALFLFHIGKGIREDQDAEIESRRRSVGRR